MAIRTKRLLSIEETMIKTQCPQCGGGGKTTDEKEPQPWFVYMAAMPKSNDGLVSMIECERCGGTGSPVVLTLYPGFDKFEVDPEELAGMFDVRHGVVSVPALYDVDSGDELAIVVRRKERVNASQDKRKTDDAEGRASDEKDSTKDRKPRNRSSGRKKA